MLQLRDYQQEAVDDLFRYFESHDGHPLVVMPTGSGKSIVIAEFVRRALEWDARVLVATHVRELVEQDASKLEALLAPGLVGVNCDALGRRDREHPVLCASVQSVFRDEAALAGRNLVLVDEAHLVGPAEAGMYRKLIRRVQEDMQHSKVVGYTATPFRMKGGWLHAGDKRIFTDVAHSTPIGRLLEAGWLAPLVAKAAHEAVDVRGLKVVGGDYQRAGMEAILCPDAKVEAAVAEIVERGRDRRSWLVFCAGIEHARKVCAAIERRGIQAACIFGDTPAVDRRRLVADFRDGILRCVVNVGVLTTGFDAPAVDLLAFLRPTKSPGLYVQVLGRGMRTAPGKRDCLVLDFGGNVDRHGAINALHIPEGQPPADGVGMPPAKRCPACDSLIHAALRQCPDCGHEFPPPRLKHAARASTASPIAPSEPGKPERVRLEVAHVSYALHPARGAKPASVRVEYLCGLRKIKEWLCIEHGGFAAAKAREWWYARSPGTTPPETTAEALERCRAGEPRPPRALLVELAQGKDQFPRVVDLFD